MLGKPPNRLCHDIVGQRASKKPVTSLSCFVWVALGPQTLAVHRGAEVYS